MVRLVRGLFTAAVSVLMGFSAHALDAGAQAPDFSGESTQGSIRLSELRGKNVILAFYYADFTSG